MLDFAIVAVAVLALAAMSLRANGRFDEDRLPMQWSLDGTATAFAPRAFVLAFTPVLSIIVLGAIASLAVFGTPGHRQGDIGTLVLLVTAAVFVGSHVFHLWMIGRTIRA